jgi:hypothetical protein
VNRRPQWNVPHQPRLDWQMWFAAYRTAAENPWFEGFLLELLKGSPPVLALLASDPFPGPSAEVCPRAALRLSLCRPCHSARTGQWWVRRPEGLYFPQVSPADFRRMSEAGSLCSLRAAAVPSGGRTTGFLRYRAMVNRVCAPGLQARPYFHRYTEDALDLCDVFGSYTPGAKIKLDEICKIIGLPGKPSGIDGGEVEVMIEAGRIAEVAQYCESDVLNTYRLWLVYELFRGAITAEQLAYSETQATDFVRTRKSENPPIDQSGV